MGRMEMDLFDYAQSRAGAEKPVHPAVWEDPGTTLWGRAWLANVRRICTPRFVSELAFAEKLLEAGRLQSCRVRKGHAQATFTNRQGGMVLVNLSVRPLSSASWAKIDRLCARCGDELFASDELQDDAVAGFFGHPDGLLPELKDLAFSCSHCRTPFCLYRAATLLAVATEFDQRPIKLFELRGATRELMFTRIALMTGDDNAEQLADVDLPSLFGIDLV